MKHYDRTLKKWVSDEDPQLKVKKRDTCKGGRPHDYVEVLPYPYEADERYQGSLAPLYEALKAIADFEDAQFQKLAEIGILRRGKSWRGFEQARYFICSVCGKKHYSYKK